MKDKTQTHILQINKEEINKLNLVSKSRVIGDLRKRDLMNKLRTAIRKPATDDGVSIVVASKDRGLFRIKSPILNMGPEFVMLKGGTMIPLKSIVNVRF